MENKKFDHLCHYKKKVYRHYRTKNGILTVCLIDHIKKVTDGDIIGLIADHKISYTIGFSFCCVKDNFSKKQGRMIAEGRARSIFETSLHPSIIRENKYSMVFFVPGGAKYKYIIKNAIKDINNGPSWFQRKAKKEILKFLEEKND